MKLRCRSHRRREPAGERAAPFLQLIANLERHPADDPVADVAGPAKVIDGDMIEVAGQRIRLHGTDADGPRRRRPEFGGSAR